MQVVGEWQASAMSPCPVNGLAASGLEAKQNMASRGEDSFEFAEGFAKVIWRRVDDRVPTDRSGERS